MFFLYLLSASQTHLLSEFFTLPTIKYFEEKIDYIQGGEVVSANLIVGSTDT